MRIEAILRIAEKGSPATTPQRILLSSKAAGDFFTDPQRINGKSVRDAVSYSIV